MIRTTSITLVSHRDCLQVTPPAICLQLLSLPPSVYPSLNRVTVQGELMRASLNPPPQGGALPNMQMPHVIRSQASMPIMLGSLLHHQASIPSFRQKIPELEMSSDVVDALAAMWIQPVRGTYSRFFGQSTLSDEPILAPVPAMDGRQGEI